MPQNNKASGPFDFWSIFNKRALCAAWLHHGTQKCISLSPFHPATLEKGPDSDEATCLRNQLWKSPSSFSRRSDLVLEPPVDKAYKFLERMGTNKSVTSSVYLRGPK